MKNAMLLILGLMAACAKAQTTESYHGLLIDKDTVRQFWAPCDERVLRNGIELEEMRNYEKSGFKLVAKIMMKIPHLPECEYLFVRKSELSDSNGQVIK